MLHHSAMDISNNNRSLRRVILFVLFLLTAGATGLRDVRITVPPMVRSRDSALLTCDYDLEGADLYSIRWYHEEEEFYRFVPKEAPPQAIFPVRDIQIDSQHSNTRDVTLVDVSKKLTGRYRCEISADAPSFHTVIKSAPMVVVDVPETDPSIEPERQRLQEGETLRANCTSGASNPAPTITWALNGDPLNHTIFSYKTRTRVLGQGENQATQSTLELKTSADFFRDGKLILRCFAAISTVYTASAELVVTEDTPLHASISGDASPHLHPSSGSGGRIFSEIGVLSLCLVIARSWSR